MQKRTVSPQSVSFIALFLIALLGTYGTLIYSQKQIRSGTTIYDGDFTFLLTSHHHRPKQATPAAAPAAPAQPAAVSTEGWKTYSDQRYHFTFQYPPSWKISKGVINSQGFYELTLSTDRKDEKAKIFLSRAGYLGIDGLAVQHQQLAGNDAVSYNDEIFGIKPSNYYYTFDLATAADYKAEFVQVVASAVFPPQ